METPNFFGWANVALAIYFGIAQRWVEASIFLVGCSLCWSIAYAVACFERGADADT